jgi:dTDP-4-dehydrorhamnose reductase
VLVVGAGGMLAREVIAACGRRGHRVDAFGRKELDITDSPDVGEVVAELRPEAIVNCAAWSDVDGAEDDERAATQVNDVAAGVLAAAAAAVGAKVLYPSTDYVFDGTKWAPYLEDDMPNPLGAYARSKLGGETSVAVANPRHYIVRSSWLFGHGGKNFVETMLTIGTLQEEVLVVSDQHGCPTACADLAGAIAELIETEAFGIHHIVGEGPCSWFDFAQEIFDQAGYDTRVMSATTEMMARKAPRPAYSVLGSSREDSIALRPWREALREYLSARQPA